MFLFQDLHSLQTCLRYQIQKGNTIGFVPTMGALHAGHLSLIKACKDEGNLAVCSLFVNPTQFNQESDFKSYPKTLEKDIELLIGAGCDVLYHPATDVMYPDGLNSGSYDFGPLTQSLEGFYRPGHFDGVITIVKRLFDMVSPQHAYFGQKDFQQCAVIKEMVHRFGLPVQIHIQPIVRESNGLAMSSRNMRLSPNRQADATVMYQSLLWIKENANRFDPEQLKAQAFEMIGTKLRPEYVEIVDADTLEPLNRITGISKAVVLLAAWCDDVRLIDNMVLFDL